MCALRQLIQALLKSLYDHFVVLYDAILPQQPSLASEHALRQEEEVYARTTKATYRNVGPPIHLPRCCHSAVYTGRHIMHRISQISSPPYIHLTPLSWHFRRPRCPRRSSQSAHLTTTHLGSTDAFAANGGRARQVGVHCSGTR